MKRLAAVMCVLAACNVAHAQSANPLTTAARFHYGVVRDYVIRASVKMAQEDYAFRPTPEVRSFARLIGHLADSNYRLCSVIAGQDPPIDAGIEKSKRTKDELTGALDESFTYCDQQYAAMTDAAGTPMVKFDAGGEGARVPLLMPRLTVLAFHTQPTRSNTTGIS